MSLFDRFGKDPSRDQGDSISANRSGQPGGMGNPGAGDPLGGGTRYNNPLGTPADSRMYGNGQGGGANAARDSSFFDLKKKVQNALITELDPKLDLSQTAQVRRVIEEQLNRILAQQGIALNRQDRTRLFEAIIAEILGLGPIEPLLNDDSVTEVMVNGPRQVYVEQHGRLYPPAIP